MISSSSSSNGPIGQANPADIVNSVYLNFPLGKPDPANPEEFIAQPGQKGPNCVYYALASLRERHKHKGPLGGESPERTIEKTISSFRKANTICMERAAESLMFLKLFSSLIKQIKGTELIANNFSLLPPEKRSSLALIVEVYQKTKHFKTDDEYFSQDGIREVVVLFNEVEGDPNAVYTRAMKCFLEQDLYSDFREYLEKNLMDEEIQIKMAVLKKLDPEMGDTTKLLALQARTSILNVQGRAWEELDWKWQRVIVSNLIALYFAKSYKLEASSWEPGDPVDRIIELLKTKGPLVVSAKIGVDYYEKGSLQALVERPFENGSLPVYGFKQNAQRKDIEYSHTILLVGATKLREATQRGNTGYVYFIDPILPIDPKRLEETVKVIKLSYLRLQEVVYSFACNVDSSFEAVSSRGAPEGKELIRNVYVIHRKS